MTNKIGIFGGTFNPMHLGHLAVAQAAIQACKLDRVLVTPARVSPFRTDAPPTLPGPVRLEIVRRTCAVDARLIPCDLELMRGGVSYAVDTVRAVAEANPNAALFWIMGADSLAGLPRWHAAEDLFRLCAFIVYPRVGVSAASAVGVPPHARVRFLTGTFYEISSTEIRRRLTAGASLEGLVAPDAVPLLHASPEIIPNAAENVSASRGKDGL